MTTAPAPSPFSPTLPAFQLAWDSTSLGWLKRCPRYYQLSMLEGWQTRSAKVDLRFGQLYASGVERYAHNRASGMTHDEATVAMVRWVLEASGTRDADGNFTPWDSGDSIKNRYTLIRSLVWNVEDRLSSTFSTLILANGKPAVELSFRFQAFEIAGEPVFLSGHLDEVVTDNRDEGVYIKDDKTTKGALTDNYFKQYAPNNQMSLYSIAGRVVLNRDVSGVLVRAAQIGVNFNRFATRQVPRPKAVLDEWMRDTEQWLHQAYTFAQRAHWPMNDTACGMYGGCVFQGVCKVSPSHRKSWLADGFEKRHWNPLETRGEV